MNDENSYNLIDEPWIPVLMRDGTNQSVSLNAVFSDTDGTIADLALNPYERVAVFRLLLCIAQAALGPTLLNDEAGWLAAKNNVGLVTVDYLKKWHGRFFLYGPHAFLQPDDVTHINEASFKPDSTLVFELASGNNSTLFDHAAVDSLRLISKPVIIISFLTYQNFSANGLSGKCLWSGQETEKSVKGAPCREQSMLFTILCGNSLIESIWLNLLTSEQVVRRLNTEWGNPAWELNSLSRLESVQLPQTFLGHLVPLARVIKFKSGSQKCIIGGGQAYPQLPAWREQMASVKTKDDGSPTYISVNPACMPWRDLSSILAVNGTGGQKGAIVLQHIESLPEEKYFTIWTGGIKWEPGQAKLIDTVEWTATLSVSLLEESRLQCYENAIKIAGNQQSNLRYGVKTYAGILKVDDASRFYIPAERIYWDILARIENQKLVLSVDSQTYKDDWRKATRMAAEEAYRRVCQSVTARQMEAFSQGFSKLWLGKNEEAWYDSAESRQSQN